MIDRYALPEAAALFTDEARFGAWLEVELLATEAWARLGVVSEPDLATIQARAGFDVEAIHERERVTEHDVAAFVDVVQERIGRGAAGWVHYGLTSSDVVDTALSVTLARACDLVRTAAAELEAALVRRAREHRTTPMVGRTHGIHAEPTTFGAKLALWALQVRRDRERLARARAGIAVGKLSGAVGTYSNIDPAVEAFVCRAWVWCRCRRHRSSRAIGTPSSCTRAPRRARPSRRSRWRSATSNAPRSARSRSRSVPAPRRAPSAMPHKRNPVKSEQLCGLARVLRGNLQAALEDVALWHERDISHSSVERIILPDTLQLAYYVLVKLRAIIDGLVVAPERMLENLDASFGLVFSQPVLLALVAAGLGRDDAYRVVQQAATETWATRQSFRDVLLKDPAVTAVLNTERLGECFDLESALAHAGRAVDALDALDDEAGV